MPAILRILSGDHSPPTTQPSTAVNQNDLPVRFAAFQTECLSRARTEWQVHSMHVLILTLLRDYPGCRVCGHRDLSPDLNGNGEIEPEEWIKACPCFEVKAEWNG